MSIEEDVKAAVASLRAGTDEAKGRAQEAERAKSDAEKSMVYWRNEAIGWNRAKLALEESTKKDAAKVEYASRVLRLHATILLAQRELAKIIDAE